MPNIWAIFEGQSILDNFSTTSFGYHWTTDWMEFEKCLNRALLIDTQIGRMIGCGDMLRKIPTFATVAGLGGDWTWDHRNLSADATSIFTVTLLLIWLCS